jgi:hypothetical protein
LTIASTGGISDYLPVVADAARGGDGDRSGIEAERCRGRTLRLGGVFQAALSGGGVCAPGVREDRPQPVEPAALLAEQDGCGRRGAGREAGSAHGRLGIADEQRQIGVAAGLDPASHAGGAKAGRQTAVEPQLAHVRGRRHPA